MSYTHTDPSGNSDYSRRTPKQAVEEAIQKLLQQTQPLPLEQLAAWEKLLTLIWQRISPVLGGVTLMIAVNRALSLTQEQYPDLNHLLTTPEGLDFRFLRQQLEKSETPLHPEGFQTLVSHLLEILRLLSGDILLRSLLQALETQTHL